MKVAIIMGSISDKKIAEGVQKMLDKFGVQYDTKVISAHRTPYAASEFASKADEEYGVIIGIAGKAAHLSGVLAAYTCLPVIGVPVSGSVEGIDALLATVQMPTGVPVATVAIDGGKNAGILATEILAVSDEGLKEKLKAYKKELADEVDEMNKQV